jgi:DNA-binding transcriptional MerR regulator
MKTANENSFRALQLFEPAPDTLYTLEAVVNLAQVPRHSILVYCKEQLVSGVGAPDSGGYHFNDEAIRTLRRIDNLRQRQGINLAGTRMILELMREVEDLRDELRFLRG